jgi:hypothetical protein
VLTDRHLKVLENRGLDAETLVRFGGLTFEQRGGNGPCWIWGGKSIYRGYGRLWMAGATVLAHRLFYEALVGPIPRDHQVDHLCRNKLCVNPDHLEAVTQLENTRRHHATKTHCAQGHPWIAENVTVESRGSRRCKLCHRTKERERHHAQ